MADLLFSIFGLILLGFLSIGLWVAYHLALFGVAELKSELKKLNTDK